VVCHDHRFAAFGSSYILHVSDVLAWQQTRSL